MKNAYIDGKNNFFASANTRFGFYSCFDDVFNRKEFEKIYIIKGGSGTGKSSLMKKIREKCEREGITSQGVLCSSDPDSLDGLIAGEKTVAFIDGTSPHTTDPVYPGAIDRMVDLGNFWNEDILRKNGFRASVFRDTKINPFGCGYVIKAFGEKEKMTAILKNSGIRVNEIKESR